MATSFNDAKEAGNTAFKSGDFPEAIKQFTAAIAEDATQHVVYSNRSASYAKLEQYKDALLDANKCIDLAKDWPKGYSRRGAAYVGLRNWRGAKGAYESGLAVDPENQNMKAELALIDARLAGSGAVPQTGGGHAVGGGFSGMPPAVGPMPGSAAGTSALWLTMVVCTFFYFLPLLGVARGVMCYRLALASSTIVYALSLWKQFPEKKLATLSTPRFQQAPEAQFFMVSIMLQLSPPVPFALVPLAVYAAHNFCRSQGALVARIPLGFLRTRAAWFVTDEGTQTAHAFASISEVMVGITSPITCLLHGLRTAAAAFFYIQYLSKRYKTSWWHQTAVNTILEKVGHIFHHKYCPSPIGAVYDRIIGLLGKLISRV